MTLKNFSGYGLCNKNYTRYWPALSKRGIDFPVNILVQFEITFYNINISSDIFDKIVISFELVKTIFSILIV